MVSFHRLLHYQQIEVFGPNMTVPPSCHGSNIVSVKLTEPDPESVQLPLSHIYYCCHIRW